MSYLLDTHTAMWALDDKDKLSQQAKLIIDDVSKPLYVSVVQAWEIAIKVSIGKASFYGGSSFFLEKMDENGVTVLDLKSRHIPFIESLPFHHRDPFDRILVSIALAENLTILTADENIRKYAVSCVW